MKPRFLFFLFVCMVQSAMAQYYYLPHINTGQNPGLVNNENENLYGFGLHPAWLSIHNGNAATPAWSSIQPLPFNFMFNGTSFGSYIVSTSGIVSFDTLTLMTAPSYQNSTLPSALIPDNAICLWGIAGTGSNDKIVTRTLGTTPNRQHWISFNSYTSNANGCYVFWSIVLEETTNKIFIVDQRNGGCAQELTVGLQINSNTAISVAGSPLINGTTGSGIFITDNTYYEFIQGTQPQWQAALEKLDLVNSALIPTNKTTTWKIYNAGINTIDSITIKYKYNSLTLSDQKFSLNILPGTYLNISHIIPVTIYDAQINPITCWIELAGDLVQADDTLQDTIYTFSYLAPKKIVFEELTGTWCGYCPKGIVAMYNLGNQFPATAFPIAVHNGDPMVVQGYDSAFLPLITNIPSGMVDRNDLDIDPSDFLTYYNKHITDTPYCEVWMTTNYNASLRIVTMNVHSKFTISLDGDYRFNAAITENEVTGLTQGYAQVNYYSFMSQNQPLVGAGHNWQLDSNPVPASQMQYHHVARALLGDFDGQANSLPLNPKADSIYTHTFTYTLPLAYDETKINMIAWVQDYSTGKILNAASTTIAADLQELGENDMIVFPNPTDGHFTIKGENFSEVTIYDNQGRVVWQAQGLSTILNILSINLSNQPTGVYTMRGVTKTGTKQGRVVIMQR